MTSERGLQMNNVLSNVKFELQREEDKLKNGWYPKIISIFTSDDVGRLFENHAGFRRAIQVLLEQQLQQFMKRTLVTWVELLHQNPPPQFAMQLTLDEGLEFYPSFESLEEVVLEIGDRISTSLSTIPRLENNYFRDDNDVQKDTLDTALPGHVTEPYYGLIKKRLAALFAATLEELRYFTEKYGHLIDGTEQEEIEKFLRSDFSFEDAVGKIDSFNATIQDITNLASIKVSTTASLLYTTRILSIKHQSVYLVQSKGRLFVPGSFPDNR